MPRIRAAWCKTRTGVLNWANNYYSGKLTMQVNRSPSDCIFFSIGILHVTTKPIAKHLSQVIIVLTFSSAHSPGFTPACKAFFINHMLGVDIPGRYGLVFSMLIVKAYTMERQQNKYLPLPAC